MQMLCSEAFICFIPVVKSFETIERHQRTLCCKNVPYDVFAQRFETLFKGVKEVNIMRDKRTGRPTG